MGLIFAILLMGIPALVVAFELMELNGTIYRPPPTVPRIVKTSPAAKPEPPQPNG